MRSHEGCRRYNDKILKRKKNKKGNKNEEIKRNNTHNKYTLG